MKPRTKPLLTARMLAAVEFEATPPSRYSPQSYDEACWQRQEKWQKQARDFEQGAEGEDAMRQTDAVPSDTTKGGESDG